MKFGKLEFTAPELHQRVIIGSGIRGSKILAETTAFKSLPNVIVLDIAKGD